nr:uncharacterized protein LOC119180146 [Rhipicephalus microplus]
MDKEKFIALGRQLGLENEELREWVERECVEARDERAREREIAKENAERQQKLLEQQQKVQEQELKILELKLRLQESASRVQPMVADEQEGSSMSARGITEVCSPHKLIPPFNEARDDLDAYLQRFERVATCQGWPREKWALSLSLCMTGEALTVIGRLDPTAVLNYDQLKAALLQRFRYTAEGYREKFRKAKPEENETCLQYAARLSGYFDRWLEVGKTETSFASLRDLMISEQFMKGCSPALRIFLKERSCKTLSSLCETADNFMEAQALTNLGRERIPKDPGPSVSKPESAKKTEKPASRCFLCDKAGHRAADCWSRTKGNTFSRCGVCKQSGHSSDRCPGRKFGKDQASCMLSEKREDLTPEHHKSGYIVLQDGGTIPIVNATSSRRSANVGVADMPVVEGFLEDRPVHVLRDTGCNTVVVRQSLVPKEKFTGTTSPVYVRGPMAVLKELWTNPRLDDETKTTYTHMMELRQRLERTCALAHEELMKAKKLQKGYYDKKARQRELVPGDQVLVLLPADANKLVLSWKGPFPVIEKRSELDYLVNLGHKVTLFHINMLKKYEERKPLSQRTVAGVTTALPSDTDEVQSDEVPHITLEQTQDWTNVTIASELNADARQQATAVLKEFRDVFSDVPGKTDIVHCELKLTSEAPIQVRQYPLPFTVKDAVEEEVKYMLQLGVIERSTSAYHSPIVVVKKKDGTMRLCIDFRQLNKVILPDCEPIPRTDTMFAKLTGCNYFSRFDFTKGYWQVPMASQSKELTAFSCESGLYHFNFMPFGIKTAPAVFNRLMRVVTEGIPNVLYYFDDVLVATETWEEHLANANTGMLMDTCHKQHMSPVAGTSDPHRGLVELHHTSNTCGRLSGAAAALSAD